MAPLLVLTAALAGILAGTALGWYLRPVTAWCPHCGWTIICGHCGRNTASRRPRPGNPSSHLSALGTEARNDHDG